MTNHGMTFSVVPVVDENGVETNARALQAEGEEQDLARLDSTWAKRVAVSLLLSSVLCHRSLIKKAHDASGDTTCRVVWLHPYSRPTTVRLDTDGCLH